MSSAKVTWNPAENRSDLSSDKSPTLLREPRMEVEWADRTAKQAGLVRAFQDVDVEWRQAFGGGGGCVLFIGAELAC